MAFVEPLPALLALDGLQSASSLTLAAGLFLISVWKPLLFIPFVAGWGWVISTIYDKHAARFFLERERWNLIHLCAGTVAILGGVMIPAILGIPGIGGFLLGLGFLILVLAADLFAYAFVIKGDDRVPEAHKITLNIGKRLEAKKAAKAVAKAAGSVKLAIRNADKQIIPAPLQETPEFEVRINAEDVYLKAMRVRASQLELMPAGKDNSYVASVLTDGVRSSVSTLPGAAAIKVIDFWRSAGKMDLADRRRKQVKDIVVEQGTAKKTIRLTSMAAPGGMKLMMLFEPLSAVIRKPAELGLLDVQMAELKSMTTGVPSGVVLIAGQPDGGRTTLLYTILGMHDAYTGQVTTVEMEPQAPLEGIKANSFEEAADGTDYGTFVRSVLRRDPNVLGVAECPDANAAKEVAKSDGDRVRVYLSMRADDGVKAVEQYFQLIGDNALASKHLKGVIAHRLVRKLCTNCRQSVPMTPELGKKLGLSDPKQATLFRKGGKVVVKDKEAICPICEGVGYVGQEGVMEIYLFGDDDRAALEQGNFTALRASLRKRQLPSLGDAARAKVVKGSTSFEEVTRALSPASGGAPAAAQKPSTTSAPGSASAPAKA